MRLMRRLAGLRVLLTLSAALLSPLALVQGQTPGTPVEQILQGLSPEQIGAISQQFGGIPGAGAQQAQGALPRAAPQSEEAQALALQQQRELLREQQKQRAELQRLS